VGNWVWTNLDGVMAAVSIAGVIALGAVNSIWPPRREVNRKFEAHDTMIRGCESEIARAHSRLDLLMERTNRLATKDDISKVLVELQKQNGERATLDQKVEGVRAAVDRLQRPIDVILQNALEATSK